MILDKLIILAFLFMHIKKHKRRLFLVRAKGGQLRLIFSKGRNRARKPP